MVKGTTYMGGPDADDEEDEADQRIEILASLPRLIRINKTKVADEERWPA